MNVSDDLLLPTAEEELIRLQEEYRKAVAILRRVKREARQYARSGNPGRRDAGMRLLQVLEPQA